MRSLRGDGIRTCIIVLARHEPSEVCQLSLVKEGSGAPTGARVRRHPLLWCGPLTRPALVPAQGGFHRVCAPGDARLSALHRGGFLAPSPPGQSFRTVAYRGGCPSCLTRL